MLADIPFEQLSARCLVVEAMCDFYHINALIEAQYWGRKLALIHNDLRVRSRVIRRHRMLYRLLFASLTPKGIDPPRNPRKFRLRAPRPTRSAFVKTS